MQPARSNDEGRDGSHSSQRLPQPVSDSTSPPPSQAQAQPSVEAERHALPTTTAASEGDNPLSQQPPLAPQLLLHTPSPISGHLVVGTLNDVDGMGMIRLIRIADGSLLFTIAAADDEDNDDDVLPNLFTYMHCELHLWSGPLPRLPPAPADSAEEAAAVAAVGAVDAALVTTTDATVERGSAVENRQSSLRR